MTKVPGEVYIVQEGLEIMPPRCSYLSKSIISFSPQLSICSSTCLSVVRFAFIRVYEGRTFGFPNYKRTHIHE